MAPQTIREENLTSLRRRAGVLLGDFTLLKATEDGDTGTFVDRNHVIYADYTGNLIYFATGPNSGSQRKITNTVLSEGRLEWAIPLETPTALYDEAELWNSNGQSWSAEEVNNAVREAHRRALEHGRVATIVDAYNFDSGANTFEIPEEIWGVTAVEWQKHNGDWASFPRATRANAPGYWVVRGERKISMIGFNTNTLANSTVRIRGYVREGPLLKDSDKTQMNTEWIVIEACRIVLQAAKGRFAGDREIADRYRDFEDESKAKRVLVRGRREPTLDLVM